VPKYELDQKINMNITNTKIDQLTNSIVAYRDGAPMAAAREVVKSFNQVRDTIRSIL
jgi:hypothetical protein